MPRGRVKLTKKQRQYAQERANGKSMTDAYIAAGYSAKCKRSNIAKDAYHLECSRPSSPVLRAEIARLQKQAEEGAILARKERQALLTEIALDAEEKTDNRLRAADMLNRMSGDYTDNVRSTVNAGVALTYDEKMKMLTDALEEEEQ